MLKAITVLELYKALSPEEQAKCRAALGACNASKNNSKTKKQRPQLRPEHSTDALVYDLIVRQNGITFKNTNMQGEKPAYPTR